MVSGKSAGLTKKKVLEAIPGSRGLIKNIAKRLGVVYETLYHFIKNQEDRSWFDDAVRDVQEEMADIAEDRLFDGLDNGDPRFINFYLSTKARNRGYIKRVENEVSGIDNSPTIINVIKDTPKNNKSKK